MVVISGDIEFFLDLIDRKLNLWDKGFSGWLGCFCRYMDGKWKIFNL